MLKLTPRLITLGLLLLFMVPVGAQHLAYFLLQYPNRFVSDGRYVNGRRDFRDAVQHFTKLLTWLERVDYDLQLPLSNPGRPSGDVVVVEVGERSLRDLGQFPFTRSVYRTLIERMEKAGAKVIAFDVTFPEHDSSVVLLKQLTGLRHRIEELEGFDSKAVREIDSRIFALDADEVFSTALHNARVPVIIGFTFAQAREQAQISDEAKSLLFDYSLFRRNFPETGALTYYDGETPVVPIVDIMHSFNERGAVGHINPTIDDDSVIRTLPAVMEFEGHVLGSLALRAISAFYGEEPVVDGRDGIEIRGVHRGPDGTMTDGRMRFPLNFDGTFRLWYYGKGRTFPYVEFSSIVKEDRPDLAAAEKPLDDARLRELVNGKIVFIGATATGLKDLRATPFDATYPGVETHATMASNVLEGRVLLRDWRIFCLGYLFIAVFGCLVSWVVYRFHPAYAFGATVASVLSLFALAHLCYDAGIVAPSILPSLCCVSVFFTGVLYRYFTEEREKRATRAAFSRYVSSAVVEEILKDQTKLRLGGQKKELTVMFVDLVGFAKLTEHLDASFVSRLLNEYFTRMTNILLRNGGTLDKYMGDALMCFWNAPLETPEHALLACRTALEIREELTKISAEWKEKHGFTIDNRIGVHTGIVAVGNMGSDQVFSYTAMGDGVNLASRLEGVNTAYGTNVVVSKETAARAGGGFLFRPLDRVQVKGREDAVDIFELVSFMPASEPEWVHAFRTGLAHYQAGEWDDAESSFGACLTLKPQDNPSQVFIDRIRDFRIVTPDEWSGVWKLSSK